METRNKIAKPEVRKLITASILDLLEHLPESQRDIFILKHYRGVPEEEIANQYKCSRIEVEAALRQVNFTLIQRAGALLA
jgi:DNA-directed RNA polymerase specialized sigma24 family protein